MLFRLSLPPQPRTPLPDFALAWESLRYVVAVFGPWGAWAMRVLGLLDGNRGRTLVRMVQRAEARARFAVIAAAQALLNAAPPLEACPPNLRVRPPSTAKRPPPADLAPGATMRIVCVARQPSPGRGPNRRRPVRGGAPASETIAAARSHREPASTPSPNPPPSDPAPKPLARLRPSPRGGQGGRVTGASLAARMDRLEALLRLEHAALAGLVRRVARRLQRLDVQRGDPTSNELEEPDRPPSPPPRPNTRQRRCPARAGPRIRAL